MANFSALLRAPVNNINLDMASQNEPLTLRHAAAVWKGNVVQHLAAQANFSYPESSKHLRTSSYALMNAICTLQAPEPDPLPNAGAGRADNEDHPGHGGVHEGPGAHMCGRHQPW